MRIHCTINSAAPAAYRWTAIDTDTYDGAPDSPTRREYGQGPTQAAAVDDLLERMDER